MKTLITSLMLLASSFSFAGQGREGGTPILVRQNINEASLEKVYKNINYLLTSGVAKRRAIYILKNTSDYQWQKLNLVFSRLELIQDIKDSTYKIVNKSKGESCIDKYGKEKFATAKSGNLGGDICFDLSKVYDNQHLISYDELFAIIFHEHLHHFSVEDIDHKIGTKMASLGNYLPMNIIHGSCRDNLIGGQDSFNHRLYADDFGLDDHTQTEDFDLKNYKEQARTVISHIYEYSGCKKSELKLKLECETMFEKQFGRIKSSDFICKASTNEGFMYLTQDMLGFMNVSFNRWD